MYFATGDDPTNDTPCTSGWSSNPSTASREPLTRFSTPGGKPAWWISSKILVSATGTCSDGLTMKVFPQATAYGRNQKGTMAGKLKGQMAAKTPSGVRI